MRAKKPYHKRRPVRAQISELCGSVGPDDGLDPRLDPREAPNQQAGRKALQLGRQAQHALGDALAGCHDPVLQQLHVVSVASAPHSGRMQVLVRLDEVDPTEVMNRLAHAAPRLRCEVASAIHRRRAPELAFCVVHE